MVKVLYVQHAGALGGSVTSLLTLIQGLDRTRYMPIVACIQPTESVLQTYRNAGIETFYWPGIAMFPHTTGGWYPVYHPASWLPLIRFGLTFRASTRATRTLIDYARPDLIHLNSLVLPASAIAAKAAKTPLVWHIRESVVDGAIGLRKRWMGNLVATLSDEAIFISSDGRRRLVGDEMGQVIPNCVDFAVFDKNLSAQPIRDALGLPNDAKVILFLGARNPIKGIFPLLKAMPLIRTSLPDVHLVIAGGAYHFSGRWQSRVARGLLPLIGSGTAAQRADRLLDAHHLSDCVHLLEWRSDIPILIAACDVMACPWTLPHFARPILEAGAMAKPVVASEIGGAAELVVEGQTGLLVPPDDSAALADALIRILSSPDLAHEMGQAGYNHALQHFTCENHVRRITQVYESVLNR